MRIPLEDVLCAALLYRLFSYGRTGRRIAFITFATVEAAQRAKVTLSAHPEWRSISFAKVGL